MGAEAMDWKLLTGALEMLIMEVLAGGPSYGYEIAQEVLARSHGYFDLKEGSLYPALHRLEQQRYLASYWRQVDGRRRKYYRLTAAGRRALAARRKEWLEFAAGVNRVLGLSGELA